MDFWRKASSGTLLSMLFLSLVVASAGPNKSSLGGISFPAVYDEQDVTRTTSETEESATVESDDLGGGGFPSLEGMLQWAIGHSDPSKLREASREVKKLSANEIKKRQTEMKDLMEKLKMPSDAELMKVAIADLNNSSLSFDDRLHALHELLILVEPIDNANDLDKLGGLVAVIKELESSNSELRTISAWILGKACQNNPLVQKQIIDHGALDKLMTMAASTSVEEAVKALYAISAVTRNNIDAQEAFYAKDGELMLQNILSNLSSNVKLRRKAVVLAADLAQSQLEGSDTTIKPYLRNKIFLKAVVDLTSENDLDLQEKALTAIKTLLQLGTDEALAFRDFCGLEQTLENMRKQFEGLMMVEDQLEFVGDMEILRQEVHHIFLEQLEKGFLGTNIMRETYQASLVTCIDEKRPNSDDHD